MCGAKSSSLVRRQNSARPGAVLGDLRLQRVEILELPLGADEGEKLHRERAAVEIAGEIETIGDGVDRWSVGDRVIAVTGHGGLAEKVVIPAAAILAPVSELADCPEPFRM